MRLKLLGSGDAFGSSGRFNTCFLVDRGDASFLIDCGSSAMIAIRKFSVDPNSIETVVLSHLHADHFGGLRLSSSTANLLVGEPERSRLRGLKDCVLALKS